MVLSLGSCRNDKAMDEAIETSNDTSEEEISDDSNDLEDTDTVVEDTEEEN